jgi:hypothetical protein
VQSYGNSARSIPPASTPPFAEQRGPTAIENTVANAKPITATITGAYFRADILWLCWEIGPSGWIETQLILVFIHIRYHCQLRHRRARLAVPKSWPQLFEEAKTSRISVRQIFFAPKRATCGFMAVIKSLVEHHILVEVDHAMLV